MKDNVKKKVLLFGSTGLLGTNWIQYNQIDQDIYAVTNRQGLSAKQVECLSVDLTNKEEMFSKLPKEVDFVVNAIGFTDVKGSEADPEKAYLLNSIIPKNIAEFCKVHGLKMVHISTDHIFSGNKCKVSEDEIPAPLNQYATTKELGEKYVKEELDDALIIRTNFFGWGHRFRTSFSDWLYTSLKNEEKVNMYEDIFFSPIYVKDLINIINDLVDRNACGIFNVGGSERLSKLDFAQKLCSEFGFNSALINPSKYREVEIKRPVDMSLDVSKVEKELGRKVSGVSEMLKELHLDLNRGIHRKNNDLITSPNKVIPYGKHYIDKKDIEGVVNVLKDGFLTQGPLIEKFERKLADFVGAKYAVAMSSWTAGLHMAVMALGLKEGDGIVTSPNSFVASSNCGIYEGATPYFCDIDIKSGNMCPISLEKILIKNPHIKAIIPVHFGGFPCEMEKISAIAKKYDCKMIEDGAQALGGVYRNGKKIGDCQYSDMVGFSFHPVKNIACGEGGMLVTNDKELYLKLLRIRSHGIDKSHDLFENLDLAETDGEVNSWYYEMQSLGYNFRITDIQCSLGITQLDKLPGFMLKRIAIANRYDEAFEGLQNAYPIQIKQRELSGNHLYVLQVDFKKIGKSRNAVIKEMIQNGVFGHVHYIPIPMQPFYQKNYPMDVKSELPEVYKYYDGALTIPLFSSMTEDEITTVISVVKKVIG